MHPIPDHGEHSYKGNGKLEGKVALITGADSGIGKAVAIAFAREGADILISYLSEDEDAADTAKWVREAGSKAVVVAGDIKSEDHCKALVQGAVDVLGHLDILVNNAAFQRTYGDIADITAAEWDETFKTNIYAPFFLSKAAIPHMKPGSAIINTTSIQSRQPSPQLPGLRIHQGCDLELHRRACRNGRGEGYSRECRCSRSDLDPAHSVDHAFGKGG